MKHKCDGCKYKGEHQEMGFKPFGVCTKGFDLVEGQKVYNAEVCPYKKQDMKVLGAHKSNNIEDIELMGEDTLYGSCPMCYELVCSLWCPSYCGDCGQKIEWE